MELSLRTDGALAAIRVHGRVAMGDTGMLSDYLRVARENGAVRCIVDLSSCTELPTTIMAVLMREGARMSEAGGALSLTGVGGQNPFLTEAVASARFLSYRTLEEAWETERTRAEATRSAGARPSRPAPETSAPAEPGPSVTARPVRPAPETSAPAEPGPSVDAPEGPAHNPAPRAG